MTFTPAARVARAQKPQASVSSRRSTAGVFRKLDPDMALQVLWGAVHGVIALILTAEGFPFAARSKLVDAAIENAIRGMTNPTDETGARATG